MAAPSHSRSSLRAVSVLASLLSVAGLAACGSDDNVSSAKDNSVASTANCKGKDKLTAAGSTAQKNAVQAFTASYAKVCPGKNLDYQANGSGSGITGFVNGQVDFAGSDSALSAEQAAGAAKRCGGNAAWHLPLVFGPVAIAYNLPGVDKLVLTGENLAKIFNGAIATWGDSALVDANPQLKGNTEKISVFHRSDDSGTTDNFQTYLGVAGQGAWDKGAGKAFKGVGEGAKGSDGVAQNVAKLPGSISYVEKSFADANKLAVAQIDNGSGPVALTSESAGKAVTGAKTASGDAHDLKLDLASIYGSKEPGVYPLVLATYEVVCSKGYDGATAQAVKSYLSNAASKGQADLASKGYVPLPEEFKSKLVAAIDALS
ncbi:phosphate ABC transporter substrate-binding protein PstS [Segniliparus rugosus]|uniref:Phosphate-binding protein n=1 Tax=Segniliparus rugosus (strain ATCC BAA-974 / DSM 45345 / CCUG 50838 / CIP 108380 / JCM 13579 / CDC 945) TaxID=679197 RepID=E5XLZ1_SEGRC|nr:phosphate ABC transporter substrate-binding protein PstS [Segniliparus rugosus]EFV14637.1 phosphate ABC transporter, phosphate-binding protein PstS [Segniliparus rugosus ATCC BAA-974]